MLAIEIATLVILFLGLGFGGFQLRSMHRTREAELLVNLTMLWEAEPLRRGREAIQVNRKALTQTLESSFSENVAEFIKLISVANFFETIGVLADLHCLTYETTNKLFGTAVREYYKLYDEYIKTHRGEDPTLYINFENLMKKHLK